MTSPPRWLERMAATLTWPDSLHFHDLVAVGWARAVSGKPAWPAMVDYMRDMTAQECRLGVGARSTSDSRDLPTARGRQRRNARPVSLDSAGDVAGDSVDPADVAVARDVAQRMGVRERRVAMLTAAGWTLAEVAEAWGVSESRVCQLRGRARDELGGGGAHRRHQRRAV